MRREPSAVAVPLWRAVKHDAATHLERFLQVSLTKKHALDPTEASSTIVSKIGIRRARFKVTAAIQPHTVERTPGLRLLIGARFERSS